MRYEKSAVLTWGKPPKPSDGNIQMGEIPVFEAFRKILKKVAGFWSDLERC